MTEENHVCPRRVEGAVPACVGGHDTWQDRFGGEAQGALQCSFCGSVSAGSAISLVKQGWMIEPSTKSYKWYLKHKKHPGAWVKFYGPHGTPTELAELNALLDKQRAH